MYLDADIEILNGDKLRRIYEECHTSSEYTLFLGIESNKGGLLTPHSMGLKCDTKHELLSFILNLYETAFSTPVKYFFLKFPIPDLFSLYFKNLEVTQKYTESTNGLFFNRSKPFVTQLMKIYPQDYFSPVITYNNSMLISAFSSNTCLCHHFAATWKQRQQNMGSFSNLLKSGYYTISDTVLSAIKSAYPNIPIKNRKPLWTLTKNELSKFEIFLNNCIPYESFLYQFFRKYFRKSYN
jgi:hypothetical protein